MTNHTLAKELELTPGQSRAAFGAARAVVEAGGPAGARGAELLRVLAATLELGEDFRVHPVATADDVRAALPDAKAQRLLVDALVIAASIEGEVTLEGESAVRSLAAALGVRSHWVELLTAMRKRRVLAIKRGLVSHSPDGQRVLSRTMSEEGAMGLVTIATFLLGVYRDDAMAKRFRALGALPVGTFGRGFHDDFVGRGMTFPGERGGLPERMIHHDLMHAVNRYGTDPAGECELGGFYAGFCERFGFEGWFTFFVVVLATFQLGLPVSPAIVTPARGAFDPGRVLAAFLRGRQLNVDVMGRWDYWALMPLPVSEVRAQLGLTR